MAKQDYYGERKWCENCKDYVRYLMSVVGLDAFGLVRRRTRPPRQRRDLRAPRHRLHDLHIGDL